MHNIKNYLTKEHIFIGLVASIAFLASSLFIGNALSQMKNTDGISVSGTAERFVTSDAGKWTFSLNRVSSQDSYASETKKMRDDMETIAKYLVGRGVTRESISVKPVTSSKICSVQQQESYGATGMDCRGDFSYALSQRITVESKDVVSIKDLSLNAPLSLQSTYGILIKGEQVEYFYNGLGALKTDLLAEAMTNAYERANALAKSSGGKVGSVKNASQGVFQITGKNSIDVSDYGTYDTEEIEKKVTAVVRASFSVK